MNFWEKGGRVVVINQSGANVRIAHAKQVNATQIGGTINNYFGEDGELESSTIDEQLGQSGRSFSVGVVNYSDFDVD